ncbi:MAG: beta-lactamase family protein [Flavobacteriaceae bacterium]|nr:beta-lactamase family protein [Flavobacteriaceae bacterium]
MKSFNLFLFILCIVFTSCKDEANTNVSAEIEVIENGLLSPIQVKGDSVKKFNLLERMEHYKVPGVSIAVVENGKIKWAKGYGIANTETKSKVDKNTIFQAGSISKPIAALAALKLAQEGKVDLDEDVNTYLKGWKIPENTFTGDEKVTLRRLLTHTANMTVHGFPGYKQKDTFPSDVQVLNGKGNTSKIFVDGIPGSIWRYSGGGYTVMEKVVEDVSGQTLDVYLAENVLQPIGMKHSTYQQPIDAEKYTNISAAYDNQGKLIEGLWNNYPEQAAAGLWTTPSDLAKYCIEIQQILGGKETGVLSKETTEKMLTKHKNNWGLGPSLQWEKDSLIFRHGGKNAGFTNEMVAFANRGSAVVIMTNADNGGKLMGEVLRAISKHYNWNVSNQRIVERVAVSMDQLEKLVGKYQLTFQVPNIGNYIIEVKIQDNKLVVIDPNNGEVNTLTAIGTDTFLDLESGNQVTSNRYKEKQGILFDGQYQFYKLEK